MEQLSQRGIWQYVAKLQQHLLFDLAILLRRIYSDNIITNRRQRNPLNHNRLSLRGLLPTLESEPGSLTRSCASDPLPERFSEAAAPPTPANFDSHRGVAEEIGIQEERLHQRLEAGGHTLTRPPGTQDLSGAVRSPLLTHPSPEVSPLATSLLADCGHLGRGMSGVYVIALRL
ncbi:unnamed protein product [Rangifer tarandus platyrhynchus]|uniref:Uncharacterized protein n=1 Tax=Rangifer tarandus platyrhynchus TaxID=3082113 RepID=A0AC59YJB1_RANTA